MLNHNFLICLFQVNGHPDIYSSNISNNNFGSTEHISTNNSEPQEQEAGDTQDDEKVSMK